jgi:hypothetical protein
MACAAAGGGGGNSGSGSNSSSTKAAATAAAPAASMDWLDGALGSGAQDPLYEPHQAASTSSSPAASARGRHAPHGGRNASTLSMDEQERELVAVTEALPRSEARLEALALWVGAAVAFGGGIWYTEGAAKAQEFFAG